MNLAQFHVIAAPDVFRSEAKGYPAPRPAPAPPRPFNRHHLDNHQTKTVPQHEHFSIPLIQITVRLQKVKPPPSI